MLWTGWSQYLALSLAESGRLAGSSAQRQSVLKENLVVLQSAAEKCDQKELESGKPKNPREPFLAKNPRQSRGPIWPWSGPVRMDCWKRETKGCVSWDVDPGPPQKSMVRFHGVALRPAWFQPCDLSRRCDWREQGRCTCLVYHPKQGVVNVVYCKGALKKKIAPTATNKERGVVRRPKWRKSSKTDSCWYRRVNEQFLQKWLRKSKRNLVAKKARTYEWVIVTYGRFLVDRRAPRVTKATCTFWSQPKARENL